MFIKHFITGEIISKMVTFKQLFIFKAQTTYFVTSVDLTVIFNGKYRILEKSYLRT